MSQITPDCEGLSVEEIDKKLDEAVSQHEVSEFQICFLLLEMQNRRGFEEFSFSTIQDYPHQRFGYIPRKTYYMLSLARKLENLPQITKAFEEGWLRWFKAHRIASVAKPEDEVMWLESALSMAVKDLDRKIRNEVGLTYTKLRFCLSEDQAAVVEYALEVCRKVSGAELSPEQCLEYMAAEFLATYAHAANKEEDASAEETPEIETNEMVVAEGDHSACPENGMCRPRFMCDRAKLCFPYTSATVGFAPTPAVQPVLCFMITTLTIEVDSGKRPLKNVTRSPTARRFACSITCNCTQASSASKAKRLLS